MVKREYDRWVTARATARREYDKWFKVKAKLHEADVERKRQIKAVADFLKQVLPTSSSPNLSASHVSTQTELGPATPAKRNIKSETPATPAKHHIQYKTPRRFRLNLAMSFMRRLLRRHRPLLKKETTIMMMIMKTPESHPTY